MTAPRHARAPLAASVLLFVSAQAALLGCASDPGATRGDDAARGVPVPPASSRVAPASAPSPGSTAAPSAAPAAAPTNEPFPVPTLSATGNTVFGSSQGGCELTIELSARGSVNDGNARLDWSCDVDDPRHAARLQRLLESVRMASDARPPFRSLFVGRAGAGGLDVMGHRLALAALRSPLWDKRRGEPAPGAGHKHHVVGLLASPDALYPEGQRLFRAHGLCLGASSVEKIQVLPVSKLPHPDPLLRAGAPPNARVPFDVLLHFEVTAVVRDPATGDWSPCPG